MVYVQSFGGVRLSKGVSALLPLHLEEAVFSTLSTSVIDVVST